MVKAIASILAAALLLYACVLAVLWWKQEALLFYPAPLPATHVLATEPDVRELAVPVDGAVLSVLHLRRPAPRGLVFFLHGNGGNLSSWFTQTGFYRQVNFDLVMLDYRGYGKSTGRIRNAGQLRDDVRAVWDRIAPAYEGRRVVLYGRSLGSALAADLAEQLSREGRPPALTILVSPYSSLRDLAGELYPWAPSALLRYPLNTASHLPHVSGPVLLVHGAKDTLIGVHHSHALQRLAPAARLLVVPQADHNDVHLHPLYRTAIKRAFDSL